MTNKDTIEMIERCINEITDLRAQLAAAQPRAEAYDTVRQILDMMPRTSRGYGEDIVWKLKKQIEELRPEPLIAPQGTVILDNGEQVDA